MSRKVMIIIVLATAVALGGTALSISSIGGLPRTPLMGQSPAVAPYNPPPINNPSEEIMQSNQSFPLNRGLGNNPTDRDTYVREHE
jgi:hypothetical protein